MLWGMNFILYLYVLRWILQNNKRRHFTVDCLVYQTSSVSDCLRKLMVIFISHQLLWKIEKSFVENVYFYIVWFLFLSCLHGWWKRKSVAVCAHSSFTKEWHAVEILRILIVFLFSIQIFLYHVSYDLIWNFKDSDHKILFIQLVIQKNWVDDPSGSDNVNSTSILFILHVSLFLNTFNNDMSNNRTKFISPVTSTDRN